MGKQFFIFLWYVNNQLNYCSSIWQHLFHSANHPRIECG
jgi:hypothetical protein